MIAQTGWTTAELRAQPARLVRALAYRAFVKHLWLPALAEAARTPVNRDAFPGPQAWLDAVKHRDAAAAALRELESALWPEDDDG